MNARILVADDDRALLDAVSEALEGMSWTVVRAIDGGELIERLAEEGPFDLVVTDVSMPWMGGLQAMQSARTAGVGTPVIVMTARRDDGLEKQVRALGQSVVLLRKPFPLEDLEAAATTLLAVPRVVT